MIKIINILFLVAFMLNSYAQRTAKQVHFLPSKAVNSDIKLKKTITEEKNINLNILWEEHFNTYNSANANGIPNNWVVNSTATDTLNQWRILLNNGGSAHRIGIPWTGVSSTRNEELITEEFAVNNTNPALWFDFSTSYYWFVQNNSDDIIVSISDDNFITETIIWQEDDSTMVTNSNVPWPFLNFKNYTARINIANWLGSNVKVKFNIISNDAVYVHGISYYLDNIMSVQTPNYDLEIQPLHIFDDGGIYTLLPLSQLSKIDRISTSVKNLGVENLTNCSFLNYLIYNTDTPFVFSSNAFVSGNTDLNVSEIDSFSINNIFIDSVSLFTGDYTFIQKVVTTEIDSIYTNNSFSFPLELDEYGGGSCIIIPTSIARETRINTEISPSDYSNATPGDRIGYEFSIKNNALINKVTVNISDDSDAGTTIRACLYEYNETAEEYLIVGQSDDYDIETENIGNELTLLLGNDGCEIESDKKYIVTIAFWWEEGESKVGIKAFNNYPNNSFYNGITKMLRQYDDTWFSVHKMPVITVGFRYILNVNEPLVNKNKNIKLYPNPTARVINIDNVSKKSSIKIYNMLGNELVYIKNANEFNQIDLSNFETGTYLVKIYNNESVVVKKLSLVN